MIITILYIISVCILLANTICVYIMIKSINYNKQINDMNAVIKYLGDIYKDNKFIVRDKDCNSLQWFVHTAVSKEGPVLILDIK